MSDFVHLHTHSEYSLLDGLGKVEDLVTQTKAMGMDAMAITDHGAMYGAFQFYQLARKAGIKPIIGLEAYMAPRLLHQKESKVDTNPYHLILLAKNIQGYRNLMRLTTIAHLQGFYYKPRIDKHALREHRDGLICLSGCLNGEISRHLQHRQEQQAYEAATAYMDIFGDEHFYLELQRHPNIAELDVVNEQLVAMSRKLGIPLVATNDIHYIAPDDAEAHELLLCVQTQHTMLERKRPLSMIDSPDFYIRTPEQMKQLFVQYPEAIANTRKIADRCNLNLPVGQWILPPFDVPAGKTTEEFLREQVSAGIKDRYSRVTAEVRQRCEYELGIIEKKGYATYFLIVADFVNWAKQRGIAVGPGRGSAAGSVVSYALGITGVDPLYFELPFERFLNPHRPSPPDIDLDFADIRRDEVIGYVRRKYGEDKVAQIITFGTMEARQAVRDAGRALGMPYAQPDRIAKMIPAGAQGFPMNINTALQQSPDLSAAYKTEEDTHRLLDLAQKLEGVSRHASTHAAGVVIADKHLTEYTPLQKESRGEKIITQYDMYTIGEDGVGLLKMDFLGLRNLSIIQETIRLVAETRGETLDIEKIPIDHAKTYELLSNGETIAIFQLESAGMRRYIKELKPNSIFDVMAMVALFRPGPMKVIPEFIERKNNPASIRYPDPRLKDVLKQSYGLITYQDDVLLTAIHLAGYSWGEADKLRKAVGKKIPSEMEKQRQKFIKGCVANGLPESQARHMFELIEPFAGYGFNKAHAACYAMIAYQTAYLKASYPVEFMTSVLIAETKASSGPAHERRLNQLVDECRRMNIQLLPPDINTSRTEFSIEEMRGRAGSIRFGLSSVKNIGGAAIEAILAARRRDGEFVSLTDFCQRVDLRRVNKKTFESLIKSGALDRFGNRAALLASYPAIVERTNKRNKQKASGQIGLFGDSSISAATEDNLLDVEEFSKPELLAFEKELLGFYLTDHPLSAHMDALKRKTTHKIVDFSSMDKNRSVIIGGIVSRIKRIITKKGGREMAFVRIEDTTGSLEAVVFPRTFEQVKTILAPDAIVLVKGRIDERNDQLTLVLDAAFPL